jgi:hypothetical protein
MELDFEIPAPQNLQLFLRFNIFLKVFYGNNLLLKKNK